MTNLTFVSSHLSVTVPCLWHIFHGRASKQQGLTCTCGHADTHEHTQLTPCLSHGLYLPRVRTHKALVGPALHRTRPYIYPSLLLRLTNMGTGQRRGSPSYLPTMWSGPYIVMIVSVTAALTSTYRLTSAQSPGWLDAKRRPTPLTVTHSDWVVFLRLFIILHCPPLIHLVNSDLVALFPFIHLLYPSLCIFLPLNHLVWLKYAVVLAIFSNLPCSNMSST